MDEVKNRWQDKKAKKVKAAFSKTGAGNAVAIVSGSFPMHVLLLHCNVFPPSIHPGAEACP